MRVIAAALATACFGVAPAMAAETVTAVFTQPDGGDTTGLYDGIVTLTVSGVGQSDGADYNDAFYVYTGGPPANHGFYDLAVGTTTLTGSDGGNSVTNFLVGPLPAYNPNHTYTFQINTGVSVPTQLHFGVVDDIFADNSGAFTITVDSAVPEPATWAVLITGMFGLGAILRRRRTGVISA